MSLVRNIDNSGSFYTHCARLPRILCSVWSTRRTDWTFDGDRAINERLTCQDFVDVSLFKLGHLRILLKRCLTFEPECIVMEEY